MRVDGPVGRQAYRRAPGAYPWGPAAAPRTCTTGDGRFAGSIINSLAGQTGSGELRYGVSGRGTRAGAGFQVRQTDRVLDEEAPPLVAV